MPGATDRSYTTMDTGLHLPSHRGVHGAQMTDLPAAFPQRTAWQSAPLDPSLDSAVGARTWQMETHHADGSAQGGQHTAALRMASSSRSSRHRIRRPQRYQPPRDARGRFASGSLTHPSPGTTNSMQDRHRRERQLAAENKWIVLTPQILGAPEVSVHQCLSSTLGRYTPWCPPVIGPRTR